MLVIMIRVLYFSNIICTVNQRVSSVIRYTKLLIIPLFKMSPPHNVKYVRADLRTLTIQQKYYAQTDGNQCGKRVLKGICKDRKSFSCHLDNALI